MNGCVLRHVYFVMTDVVNQLNLVSSNSFAPQSPN